MTSIFVRISSKPTHLYLTKIQAVKSVALKLSTFGIQTGYNNLSGVPASYLLKSWRTFRPAAAAGITLL